MPTKLKLLLFIILAANLTYGQSGSVKGKVIDAETNEPLPFTNVIILERPEIGSSSDLDGNFSFTGLAPGYVRLRATAVGHQDVITESFLVTNAKVTYLDIKMPPKTINLESVVIEASAFKKKEESPLSLRSLGIDEIEKNPGGNRDISKVIQSLPGVASSVSFRNDIIVRGGGPSENRFYLDGVEIPTINHFSTQGASGGPVGIINVDFVREVDFYSGAFPANRGNALSSAIEFKLVDGNREKYNFRATLGATDLAFTMNGPISKNSSLVFSARRSYLQFLFDAIGLPFLPTYNDFQLKYKYWLDNKNQITIIGLGAIDQFELNTGIENPDEGQRYILGFIPVNEQWNYTIGGIYQHFSANGSHQFVLSRNYLNNVAYKYKDNIETNSKTFDYSSTEAENKIRYERLQRLGRLKLQYGAGFEDARYTASTLRAYVYQDSLKAYNYGSEIDVLKWSLFGQASQGFYNDRLTLSFGLRMDANNFSQSMNNLIDQTSPRLSGSYQLTEKFALNMSLGRFFQQPAYTTMGFRNNEGVLVNKDNNLKYIKSDQLVGGVEFMPDQKAKLSIEGFYKFYDNYPFSVVDSISIASKGGDFGTFGDEEVVPTSRGRAYGMEIYFHDKDFFGSNLIVSYTLVRSEFTGKTDTYIPSAWDNRHILNVTFSRALKKNWDVGFKWRFLGGAPYTPYDELTSSYKLAWDTRGTGYLDYTRFNTLRLNSFHQLDIRVDKQYFFDQWSLMVYLDIQNLYGFKADQPQVLFNEDENGNVNIINPSDPIEQQRYQLRYIGTESGTVIPTIGIMVEF